MERLSAHIHTYGRLPYLWPSMLCLAVAQTVQTIGFIAAVLGKTGTEADLQQTPTLSATRQALRVPLSFLLPTCSSTLITRVNSTLQAQQYLLCYVISYCIRLNYCDLVWRDVHSEAEGRKCVLVVAPNSVITNWQREFNMWGAFRVAIYHGPQDARNAAMQGIVSGSIEILITSYDTFRPGHPSHVSSHLHQLTAHHSKEPIPCCA